MFPGRVLRVVFMGSDTLSCPFLRALAESPDVEVAAVVTQPDRGRGRHLRVTPGPVKELALSLGICVIDPPKVNEDYVVETLAGLGIDAVVVMAYGQIVGDAILDLPRLGITAEHYDAVERAVRDLSRQGIEVKLIK